MPTAAPTGDRERLMVAAQCGGLADPDARWQARRLDLDQTPRVAGRGLKALSAAFGVEPDVADLATVITRRLETNPSAADWSAVLAVLGILITIDSRNIKRLRDGHRIPKSQRSVMAQMVAAYNPDVDPDDFVGRVLALIGAALAAPS